MSKVWKSFNSKAQFLAEKELSEERERDLDLIMIIKEDENCQ